MNADYWKEAVEIALEEAGVNASAEQIEQITGVIEGAHECYGQAFGHDIASRNLAASQRDEVTALQKKLAAEKEKITCKECNGEGWITTNFGSRSGTSQCWKCHGEGRVAP